jgi:hypothetical protein
VCELNVESDVNMQFISFLYMSCHCCDTACLVKVVQLKESHTKNWVTRGRRNSCKKTHFLVNWRQRHVPVRDLECTENYRKKVIRLSKKGGSSWHVLTLSTRIISTLSTLCTRIFSVRNSN